MDISVDKSKSDGNRPGPFLAVSQTARDIVRRLIGFFKLTEADKLKAGLHPGGEGRDELTGTAEFQLRTMPKL